MKKSKFCNKWRRPRLLIIGCGDVGMRILPLLRTQLNRHFAINNQQITSNKHPQTALKSSTNGNDIFAKSQQNWRVFATTSQATRCAEIRAAGAMPIVANLDNPATLQRLAHLADWLIMLAPPPSTGTKDMRSRHLIHALSAQQKGAKIQQKRVIYISTTGVYGDCAGALIDETKSVNPHNARAIRRVDAENVWRQWAQQTGAQLSILRVPGIYAANRLPIDRLLKGTPALVKNEDVFTNHIHADDLAKICLAALFKAKPQRIYHAVDDSQLLMGDYFDIVAAHFALTPPPRLTRAELSQQVSPMLLSFMSESRRLTNHRLKQELGVRLIYKTVQEGIDQLNNDLTTNLK